MQSSVVKEQEVTKALYKDYSLFKNKLFNNLCELNPLQDKLGLFNNTQKLLDRLLFILFAEDRGLLPPNAIHDIIKDFQQLKDLDNYIPLYNRFRKYFGYLDKGFKHREYEIFAYNGGLFAEDEILDGLLISDDVLQEGIQSLSRYDFISEVDVNILGHIFEHSLNEIEEIQAELEGKPVDKSKTKRKKDGVFYTPKYITKYIVDNTVGALCGEKRKELNIIEEEYAPIHKKGNKKVLNDKLEAYRNWLLQLTILDPACGSGAFLNQALDFLIAEHRKVDELRANLFGDAMVLTDLDNQILENNIFGVDINEESVEIAKLSLWLRTAQKGRKLSSLNANIKCGNSLIDDVAVAGEKAFQWNEEFKQIFEKGGFHVVIGNPPNGAKFSDAEINFFRLNYDVITGHSEAYYLFFEKALLIIRHEGLLGFITPNAWFSYKYAIEVRKLLLLSMVVKQIINFNKKVIFDEANVETSIYIGQKTENKSSLCSVGVDVDAMFNYEIKEWISHSNLIISFSDNHLINSILK
jgi:type I restriction-modification system DNA methylase subunit